MVVCMVVCRLWFIGYFGTTLNSLLIHNHYKLHLRDTSIKGFTFGHLTNTLVEIEASLLGFYQSMLFYCHGLESSQAASVDITACLSGAAKLARRQRGDKKCDPRERGRKLEHCAARSQRSGCFCSLFSSFSIQYFTGRGASAVEILGSRH